MDALANREKARLEVADIFRRYQKEYMQMYCPTIEQLKVIQSIINCRTAALGSQTYACQDCGQIMHVFHSCRNRHCPKCQNNARQKWLEQRKQELLPVPYFHLVFTVPAGLNEIALFNKKLFYDVLFAAVNHTLSAFSADNKWLGAQYGAIAILHTWGQNLSFHPHIHLIIPSGGISEDKMEWINMRKNFFAPVKAMSITFRQKFCSLLSLNLKKHYLTQFPNELTRFYKIMDSQSQKPWVVFAQKPFKKPEHIINYLGNYTHRVAISNHRLIKMQDGFVYFRYKDYKQNATLKVMKLTGLEFMRRFLQHVLPYQFCKIRYFGFLSNRFKKQNLAIANGCLELITNRAPVIEQNMDEFFGKLKSQINCLLNSHSCPCCGGMMLGISQLTKVLPKTNNSS